MNNKLNQLKELKTFLLLWSTQSFSALGSSMTSFALIIWSYQLSGSALTTSLLSICTYAPYVIFSIFAGTLTDKWNKKKIMLICDGIAAGSTLIILILLNHNQLGLWHIYALNILNGLMNTFQQPASDVTISLLTPKHQYQKASSLRSFSNSLITVLAPALATALYTLAGMDIVIFFDLFTFSIAWMTLIFLIKIPSVQISVENGKETMLNSARSGISYLLKHRGILDLILFLAMINFTASIYNAALPAMLLSRNGGSETALGLVNVCCGLANLAGSTFLLFSKPPKSRVRVICNALLFSMSTENLLLALGTTLPIWCLGAILGWLFIPVMNTNMDVLLREYIPIEMQGRVYSARNTLQFFTIPLGYLAGGVLVDRVFEPFMALQESTSIFVSVFGAGKGSGTALLFFILSFVGIATCLVFRKDKHIWKLEQ